jgi:hypothetical protein
VYDDEDNTVAVTGTISVDAIGEIEDTKNTTTTQRKVFGDVFGRE